MKKYNELELSILSCLLQRPELMKEIKLEDKHFIKYKKLWLYMKSFYEKFGDFDLVLMTSVSKDKYRIIEYIEMLIDLEPAPSNFEKYQDLLIEQYEQKKKEVFLKERIFKLATDLYVGNIDIEKFKNKLRGSFFTADELFGDD